MRIGIDIRTLTDEYYSGISSYTLNLVRHILAADRKNEYVLFYNSWKSLDKNLPDLEKYARHLRYPNKIFNLFQKALNCPHIDRWLETDVYFMPHFNFISLSGSVKKMITIHDLSFLRYPEFFSWKKNLWHKVIGVKRLLSEFDIIVAVSENTRSDLIEICGVPEKKIRVVYSGIGPEYKPLSSDTKARDRMSEIRRKYGLPEKFTLSVCNLEPRKNIGSIVMAFDRLKKTDPEFKDMSLVIAGAKAWKSRDIFKILDKAENKKGILVTGYVDEEEKPYLYNMASLFVYPSFFEGFGFPPLEAYGCGTPVVTSNSSSLPEVIGTKCIMANPCDINELAAAMGIAVRRGRVESPSLCLDWNSTAESYINIFENLKPWAGV